MLRDSKQTLNSLKNAGVEDVVEAKHRGLETVQGDRGRAQYAFAGVNRERFPGCEDSQITTDQAKIAWAASKAGRPGASRGKNPGKVAGVYERQHEEDRNKYRDGQAFLLLVTKLLTLLVSHHFPGLNRTLVCEQTIRYSFFWGEPTETDPCCICLPCSGSGLGSFQNRRCIHPGHHDGSCDAERPLRRRGSPQRPSFWPDSNV